MSRASTEAYRRARNILDSIGHDEIDVEDRLKAAERELDAVCDDPDEYRRTAERAAATSAVVVQELRALRRHELETDIDRIRRRAAMLKRVADRSSR